jgi:hypothetical protein
VLTTRLTTRTIRNKYLTILHNTRVFYPQSGSGRLYRESGQRPDALTDPRADALTDELREQGIILYNELAVIEAIDDQK